jgi:hypothetical protein
MYKEPVPSNKIYHGCLCCGGTKSTASLNTIIFSDCDTITKNGERIFPLSNDEADKRLSDFEEMAKKEPDADWRYSFLMALRDGEYQRQGEGKWVLIKSGQGYA